ncbi:hypothetical protein INT45_002719 [Circinella minor]|uniref:Uncharacterized protein n=1 Tax=Circinella minor TaxID=1195481 RepID=A0A8H7S2U8_9FUNG|nr:hypothetical protein INT45_002719 [Circinella minor]
MTDVMDEFQLLYSLETRPSYAWTPPTLLADVLQLYSSLFPSTMISDEECHTTIDKYPNIEGLQYQPPDNMSLKRLQYLISGVFQLMDVLGLEISKDIHKKNVQCYLLMLRDCHSLLLNASTQVNKMRSNLAIQAINLIFSSSTSAYNNYIMPQEDFQALLSQQTSSAQALQKASNFRHSRKRFTNNYFQHQQSTQPLQH